MAVILLLCPCLLGQVVLSGKVTVSGNVTLAGSTGSMSVSATPSLAQTLLTYTAPNTSACNVHVYTDAGLTTEVNDTNESFYTGASNDQTRYAFNSGTTSRIFVAGTVGVPENQYSPAGAFYPGTDGSANVRSRALQTNTAHWAKVTCGATSQTISFTTNNIPRGITYGNVNPLSAAGTTWAPTTDDTNRTQSFIDPLYGAFIRKVNLQADDTRQPVSSVDAGNEYAFTQFKIQDSHGVNLNLVNVQNNGGAGDLYGIPDDGSAARFYGINIWKANGVCVNNLANGGGSTLQMNPSSLVFYGLCQDNGTPQLPYVTTCTLPASGNSFWDSSATQNTFFSDNGTCTTAVDSTPLTTRIHTFNSAFDASTFNSCSVDYPSTKGVHTYVRFHCKRGAQDTYAWLGVYDMNTSTVVAAIQQYALPNMRWCAYHTPHQTDQSSPEWFTLNAKELEGGGVGAGQYTMTLNGTLDNSTVDSSIVVNNPGSCGGSTAPCPTSPSADTSLYQIAVGDAFNFQPVGGGSPTSDWAYVTSITDSTHIAIHRVAGLTSHANNAVLQMTCGYQGSFRNYGYPLWWNFEQDPSGSTANTGNTARYFFYQDDGSPASTGFSGHQSYGGYTNDAGNGSQITEGGWTTCKSYSPGSSSPGPTNCGGGGVVDVSAGFFGASHNCSGNACQQHPTASRQYLASATEQKWGLDTPPEQADCSIQPASITSVTGSLYKFIQQTTGQCVATGYSTINVGLVASQGLLATAGAKGLQDVSGPSSLIGSTSGDNYKFCIALAVNECRSGSAIGDIYFNIPGTPSPCTSGDVWNATTDVCIGTANPYASHLVQIGYLESAAPGAGATDSTGKFVRQISQGLIPWHVWQINNASAASPDGQWLLLENVYNMANGNSNVMLAKAPPWPLDDGITRNTFETKSVTIPQTASSTNAIVEYGYDPLIFGCSSRQEACASGNNSQTRPLFETLEQSSLTGYNVTAGSASATIFGIPGKIMYYRVKQCSALPCTGGSLISAGAVQTWVVP